MIDYQITVRFFDTYSGDTPYGEEVIEFQSECSEEEAKEIA